MTLTRMDEPILSLQRLTYIIKSDHGIGSRFPASTLYYRRPLLDWPNSRNSTSHSPDPCHPYGHTCSSRGDDSDQGKDEQVTYLEAA